MNQALSLYLLDTLPLLDREAPDYALDVLTLVESILEDPDIVLRRQLDKLKGQKVAELKQAGVEYDERMEELEKLEHPKPKREFIYDTFNRFSEEHPWVGQENIRPKSVAREMFEQFRSFSDYIKDYELHRAEGALLRHLNSTYKVLSQTVPDAAKTDAVREMETYLATMLRQVDSSLLDEWEKMRNPTYQPAEPAKEVRPPGAEEAARDITRDAKAFTAAIRTRIFTFLRHVANGEYAGGLESLREEGTEAAAAPSVAPDEWTAEQLRQAIDTYHADHERFSLDPDARNLRHTYVLPSDDKRTWKVQQVLVDPEGANDWMAEFVVDLAASRAAEEPRMKLVHVGPIGSA